MKKVLSFLWSLSVIIVFGSLNGCSEDDESVNDIGGGKFKLEVTISPPLENGDIFQLLSPSYSIYATTAGYTGEITPEAAVNKGQNVYVRLDFVSQLSPRCRTIEVDAVLNGSVIDTKVFEMGYKQYPSPIEYCEDGVSKSVNYIIP